MNTTTIRWTKITILFLFSLALVFGWMQTPPAEAFDPNPHSAGACTTCHARRAGFFVKTCPDCHNGANARAASTHGKTTGGVEGNFVLECVQCHNPHSSTNLSLVQEQVQVQRSPIITTGPVVFTARTNANSFDDGASAETSRICTTCHVNGSNPGYPVANHAGGNNHVGGASFVGQNCTNCHPHDADATPSTVDGFMPLRCVDCHKQTQGPRRQIVDSNGDGSGSGGDFKRSSHHISSASIPIDSDCLVCHDQSQHRQGKVRLYNADNNATIYALDGTNDPADYESFCLACHDGNGSNGDTMPFSGTGTPATVDATVWNASSHGDGASETCQNCHDNGHGSNKVKMLAPYGYTGGGGASDAMKEEEEFCYTCHDGSPASDVQTQFGLTNHHPVVDSEHSGSIQPECASCHNPHKNNATNKVINPDTGALTTNDTAFCFTCHDTVLPVSTHGNIDVTAKVEANFQSVCYYCHAPHGSNNRSMVASTLTLKTSPLTTTGPVTFTALTGTNSFDDGTSAATSRLCYACHINAGNPGSPMVNHSGGASHVGGVNYAGQDCSSCHTHNADASVATVDGFMAKRCVDCHKTTQNGRRQIVDSNADGSGTGGDFKRATHHVTGTAAPNDSDCLVCHEQSQHKGGKVRLFNADNSATVYALDGSGDAADYESFCLACHDANGKNGDTTPFSGTGTPAVKDTAIWNASSHGDGASESCKDCHDNGHGSNKTKMLSSTISPFSATSDGDPNDPMKQEERFCYDCHDGSPASTNIQSLFGLSSHHKVADSEGAVIECSNCHNPHTNKAANKVINPDTGALTTNTTAFCQACHDGTAPAATAPKVSTHGNANFTRRTEESFTAACYQCHVPHGSANRKLTAGTVTVNTAPLTTTSPVTFTALIGANSFDDGVSAQTSRICVTCHVNASRPGSATSMEIAPSHLGGAGHTAGGNFAGLQCTLCHSHDDDAVVSTVDGFMPKRCVDCHKTTQGTRRQVVDSTANGTGTGGDFKRASHHVASATIPTDADCTACHEMTQHRAGTVRLFNADSSATVYVLDGGLSDPDYETFCLSCHDANGRGGDTTPFSGTGVPAAMSSTYWSASSHKTKANMPNSGTCRNCHDNGHGSNKLKMLAPYTYATDGNADDPLKQEERFCYDCHDGSPASNTTTAFGYGSHHIVQKSQQTTYGVQLECVNCHNPHTNTTANKVSNPDNRGSTVAPVVNDNVFCLACHDNTGTSPLPAGVNFGSTNTATTVFRGTMSGAGTTSIWDKSKMLPAPSDELNASNSIHIKGDADLKPIRCRNCHQHHGSSVNGHEGGTQGQTRDLLKAAYNRREVTTNYWTTTGYHALCFSCHTAATVQGSTFPYHNYHVTGAPTALAPCIDCHDPHIAYDVTEFGLINFAYAKQYTQGTNFSTAIGSSNYVITDNVAPTFGANCGITCHSTSHGTGKSFTYSNVDTTPVGVVPLSFAEPAAATFTIETATDPLVGTVSNPDATLQNEMLAGNGTDTYISFPTTNAMLASDTLAIETTVMPQDIPTTVAYVPATNNYAASLFNSNSGWYLNSTYWISLFMPKEITDVVALAQETGNYYEAVIFDRGADANYRLSILRPNNWDTYAAPAGVASFALWTNPVDKHGGENWKVTVTDYKSCPIVSDHWYSLSVQWDSNRPAKSPAAFFVDDLGTAGDNVGQAWQGVKNCTDLHPTKGLVPKALQNWAHDQINSAPSGFVIGARVGSFMDVFRGWLQSLAIYPEGATGQLDMKFHNPNSSK